MKKTYIKVMWKEDGINYTRRFIPENNSMEEGAKKALEAWEFFFQKNKGGYFCVKMKVVEVYERQIAGEGIQEGCA